MPSLCLLSYFMEHLLCAHHCSLYRHHLEQHGFRLSPFILGLPDTTLFPRILHPGSAAVCSPCLHSFLCSVTQSFTHLSIASSGGTHGQVGEAGRVWSAAVPVWRADVGRCAREGCSGHRKGSGWKPSLKQQPLRAAAHHRAGHSQAGSQTRARNQRPWTSMMRPDLVSGHSKRQRLFLQSRPAIQRFPNALSSHIFKTAEKSQNAFIYKMFLDLELPHFSVELGLRLKPQKVI